MTALDVASWVLLAILGFTGVRAGLPALGKETDHIGSGLAAAGCAVGIGLLEIARALG